MFREAFPDLKIMLDELVAEGNKVCARATTRGTHNGSAIFGVAASGKEGSITRLNNGAGHPSSSGRELGEKCGRVVEIGAIVLPHEEELGDLCRRGQSECDFP